MSLAAGTRLGPYEVTGMIGSGAFGDVYRARDRRLERDVAVKVLADRVAGDAGRLARFEREAKVLASLNHPNIAAIYGFEEVQGPEEAGAGALVLELVEGPTLAEIIGRGPLAPAEALAMGRQIAAALEAAHERGIVHRDLKPANVKVTADGTVKVLDFGLAKALAPEVPEADLAESPTVAAGVTREGMILGTAGYMAPEQGTGKPVDRRADIWAFGCVLYEMLTGVRAFDGDGGAEVLAAILERDPDLDALPAETPRGIRRLLRRCLRKDPRERLRDIGDARIEIDEATTGRPEGAAAGVSGTAGPSRATGWRAWAAFSLFLATLAGLGGWALARRSPAADVGPLRVDLAFPDGQEVVASAGSPAVVSPDGSRIAYVAHTEEMTFLHLRALDSFEPTRVPGSEGAQWPFFAPDGQWVGFCAGGSLLRAPVAGGEPRTIAPCRGLLLGASWGPDDTIVYSDSEGTGLWQVPAGGGTPTPLTEPDVPLSAGHRFPHQLPDGSGVLFSTRRPDDGRPQLAMLPAGASDWRIVAEGDDRFTAMRYLASGHLLYGQGSSILLAAFDPAAARFTGQPRPLITDVATSPASQYAYFSASDAGTLVYVPAQAAEAFGGLVWLDTDGDRSEVARLPGGSGGPRLSPDGSQVALGIRLDGLLDPWVYDVASGRGIRLTRNAEGHFPVWAPDGRRLVATLRDDLHVLAADGAGTPRALLQRPGAQRPWSWMEDGEGGDLIVFSELGPGGTEDVLVLSTATAEVTPLLATDAAERSASVSPDGRWLAYVSDETGREEVYVQSFPDGARRNRVSRDGGDAPRWAATGDRLFYTRGSTLLVAPVSEAGQAGMAQEVLTAPPGVAFSLGYDVAPDGRRVLAVDGFQNYQATAATRLRLILGWRPGASGEGDR